jgi:hypothetical protein
MATKTKVEEEKKKKTPANTSMVSGKSRDKLKDK